MEIKFLVRPNLEFRQHECSIARITADKVKDEEHDHHHPELHEQEQLEEKQEDNFDMFVSSLKVKIPFVGEFRVQQDHDGDDGNAGNDGLKTPTSSDHKITATLQCPPAPRKPKSLPLKKRKANRTRLLLDLPTDIESLFPPIVVADLGAKIVKKVRRTSDVHACSS